MALIAIDIGGTGSRAQRSDGATATGPAVSMRDGRADYGPAIRALARALPERGDVDAVVLGATGLVSRGDQASVAAELRAHWNAPQIILASDAVTSLVGAWGLKGGAVVAAGTGVVALGTDLAQAWARADGWGPWVGDRGGGAWIGAQGLDAAMRELDGRRGGSTSLLVAASARFGDLRDLPTLLRAADDAPALLASFVPDVVASAEGDPLATSIITDAVEHLADAAEAVLAVDVPERVALVGGISRIEAIESGWVEAMSSRRPSAEVLVGSGTALRGALTLGQGVHAGTHIDPRPPYIFRFAFPAEGNPSPQRIKEQK